MVKRILWTTPGQASGKVIRAVAAFGGVPIELPASYEHYVDNLKPEFLAKFPLGKIPALEEDDGFLLCESIPIARYIAALAPNSGLWGKDAKEAALVDQWAHLAETELDAFNGVVGGLLRGSIKPYNKMTHTTFVERQVRTLRTLNAHIATRTFYVGERITFADIYIAEQIQRIATVSFDAKLRAELPHLIRHSETVLNHPQFKGIFEPKEYVEKALQYVPPPKEKTTGA